MKTKFFTLLLCTVFFLPAKAQMSQYLADTLSALFQQRAALFNLKGVASAVVFPDGSVWTDAYGHYGANTLTPDLLYEVGSNTKTMTTGAILLLAEEGKLSLDDPIGQYLSPIPHVDPSITIRQLLNHTSGVYNFTNNPDFLNWVNQNWSGWIEPDSILPRYIDSADFAPGTDWRYSNSGYILAGLIIEAVEQKPYHQVLRERLFDPLELNDMHTAYYDMYNKHHVGTWLIGGSFDPDPSRAFMSGAWAAGAVISTPADLARWSHQFHGGRVLEEASFQEMIDTVGIGWGEGAGLGVFMAPYKGRMYLEHGGTTLQNSSMRYSMESDFSVVTMVIEQGKYTEPDRITNFLIDLMELELPHVPSTPTGTEERLAENEMRVYPNPATDYIVIESQSRSAVEVSVFNTSGALLLNTTDASGRIEVNRDQVGSGLFLVTIEDQTTGTLTQKRVVFQ